MTVVRMSLHQTVEDDLQLGIHGVVFGQRALDHLLRGEEERSRAIVHLGRVPCGDGPALDLDGAGTP